MFSKPTLEVLDYVLDFPLTFRIGTVTEMNFESQGIHIVLESLREDNIPVVFTDG